MVGAVLMCAAVALIGAGCLGWYLRNVAYVWKLWRHGTRASGRVVDHVVHDFDAGREWEPVIAFDDRNGHRVASKQIVRVNDRMRIGEVVPVIYLPHDPEVMHIDSRPRMVRSLLSHGLLLVLGVGFLTAAVFMAVAIAQGTVEVHTSCESVVEQLCS